MSLIVSLVKGLIMVTRVEVNSGHSVPNVLNTPSTVILYATSRNPKQNGLESFDDERIERDDVHRDKASS